MVVDHPCRRTSGREACGRVEPPWLAGPGVMARSHLLLWRSSRLEPIHGHCQLALVPVHRGHGRGHVVDDGANVSQLLLGGLGFGWWWRRHGSRGGGHWIVNNGGGGVGGVVRSAGGGNFLALSTKMLWLG
jgi:hypothetical protein